jgi:hypothetical protein
MRLTAFDLGFVTSKISRGRMTEGCWVHTLVSSYAPSTLCRLRLYAHRHDSTGIAMAHGPGDWFSATCIGTAFALHLDAFALHLRCTCAALALHLRGGRSVERSAAGVVHLVFWHGTGDVMYPIGAFSDGSGAGLA